jgi:hypothetical protein
MDWVAFFSRSVRNGGLTFGPYPSMDGSLGALYKVLVPPFLMFTGEDGALTFVPGPLDDWTDRSDRTPDLLPYAIFPLNIGICTSTI